MMVVFHASVLLWSYTSAPSKAATQASVAICARRVVGIGCLAVSSSFARSVKVSCLFARLRLGGLGMQAACLESRREGRETHGVGRRHDYCSFAVALGWCSDGLV